MTLDTFLAKLADASKQRGFIMLYKKIRRAGYDFIECPITAVCNEEFGTKYAACDFDVATDKLGLPKKLMYEIAWAADSECYMDIKLREKLLRVCGLQERESYLV